MTPKKANPAWPNRRPDIAADDIAEGYAAGASTKTLAKQFRCSTQTVVRRLRSLGFVLRARGKVKTFASGHGANWKGDNAGYFTLHRRVAQVRGRPSRCEICGTTEARMYHWANLTGHYADPFDYARLCVPCHRNFDYGRSVTSCPAGHSYDLFNTRWRKGGFGGLVRTCRTCDALSRQRAKRGEP
jgi:hypothetical protein